MLRAFELSTYRSISHVKFTNVFGRISSLGQLGAISILEYWYGGADCSLDRCDHRGFSSLCVSRSAPRDRPHPGHRIDLRRTDRILPDIRWECIDHMRF